jgi:hypothetical protein
MNCRWICPVCSCTNIKNISIVIIFLYSVFFFLDGGKIDFNQEFLAVT